MQRAGYRTARWSYAQVAGLAFQFARELENRQIEKADRVIIWGANSAEWVAAFFGCALRGVAAVPLDDIASDDFAVRVAEQTKARMVLASRAHAAAKTAVPSLILEDLSAALANHSREIYPAAAIHPQDTLEIVFTSGTTADPKGVVITHGNVLGNIAPLEVEIRKYLKYERFVHPIRFLNLLPLSHVFGQFLGMFLPPIMGGAVIFQESLKPAEILHTIQHERVSVVVSVPRVLQSLKEKIERDLENEGRLPAFRDRYAHAAGRKVLRRWWIFRRIHRRFGWKFWAFICGGAALDRLTEEFWGRLGFAVIQGYGLTETTSLISVNHPFRTGKGSIGKVLAGREIKLAPDGEILVRGSGVAEEYLSAGGNKPVAGEQGWYHTGDIGELDAEDNLYFKGRKKETIVTPAGMNIYPEDLELALRKQPEIKDCAIVSLPRGGNAEPCAALILRNRNADAEKAVVRANESLAEFQRMHHWFIWPEEDFPRTSTQKPRVKEIAEVARAHFRGNAEHEAGTSTLSRLISQVTGRPAPKLSPEANLSADLNLSSLDRVELMGTLEDRYQVDLSEASFSAANTVGDLERMLRGEVSAKTHYDYPAWVQRWPVTWIRLIAQYTLVMPAVFLLGWPRIRGQENLRGVRGPVLVICNHISDVDLGFILRALPARLRHKLATAAGGEALQALHTPPAQQGWLRKLFDRVEWALGVSLLNLFPLPRAAGFRESFAYAGESVDRGYSILVFPEGRHTTTGKMWPFRSGVGLLANNLRIPVVPMRIAGLFEIKQAGKKFAPPGKIRVSIGQPVRFEPDTDPQKVAQELQRRMETLQD